MPTTSTTSTVPSSPAPSGATSAPSGSTSAVIGVQYLRGVAALMVAYFHLAGQYPAYTAFFRQRLLGFETLSSGVDVFFVISGFIILISSRNLRPGAFLVRRLMRIAPLYWILTLVVAVLAVLVPSLFRTTLVSPEYLLKSLLFVPYANPGQNGDLVPLIVPGWSLNFEMFFYLLFAALLLWPLRLRIAISGAVFLVLLAGALLLQSAGRWRELAFFGNFKIFEFWMGMIIAQLYLQRRLALPRWSCITVTALGFALLVLGIPSGVLPADGWAESVFFHIVPAAMIVLGAVAAEQHRPMPRLPFLLLLGDASYSLYLTHIFSLGVARAIWAHWGFEEVTVLHVLAFAAFSMTLVVLAALAVYLWVEKPMLEQLHRLLKRPAKPAVSLATAGKADAG